MTQLPPSRFHRCDPGCTLLHGVVVLAACLTVGCASDGPDSLQPDEVESTYALATVGDLELPARRTLSDGRVLEVISDTIRFYDSGAWSRDQSFRIVAPDGRVDNRSYGFEGTVRLDGQAVVLDFECRDVAIDGRTATGDCVPPERARVTPDGLVIDESTVLHGFTLVYRRI